MHGRVRRPVDQFAYESADGNEPQSGSEIDLRSLIGVLRRHKWMLFAPIVLIVALAFLVTSQTERRYTASALMVVDMRDSELLGFEPGLSSRLDTDTLIGTEVEIARSSAVMTRAAEALDLGNSPDFQPRPSLVQLFKSMVGLETVEPVRSDEPRSFASLPTDEITRIVESFSKAIAIERRGPTNVIVVSATATSPAGAAAMANAVANAYLAEQIESKIGSSERAASFLRERVEQLATAISDTETEIDNFVASQLDELSSPEAKALLARIADEAKRRQIDGSSLADLQNALEAKDYIRLAQLAEAQKSGIAARRQALVDELARSNDQERLTYVREQLATLDQQIAIQAEVRAAALQGAIASSNDRSLALRRQMEGTYQDIQLPKDVSAELFRLQRDVETRRNLYDSLLAKLRQVEQQTDFKISDSRIVSPAVPPRDPSYPRTRLVLIGAFLFSLCIGIGLAFLREHFVGGVTSVEHLEDLTKRPVIAALPRHPVSGRNDRPDMAISSQPLSAFSEGIRRTSLGVEAYSPKDKRCILVTSAVAGDGKTTVALGLARQFAMTGRKTLLIDADLRRPAVHTYLYESADGGLINFLAGSHSDPDKQIQIASEPETKVDFILGSDASTVATDALLMSGRFRDLLQFATERYDVVIIDSPPVGLVVDATIIAGFCDLCVFVTRYASTGQRRVRAALRDLSRTGIPVVSVLNRVTQGEGYRSDYYTTTQRRAA